MPVFKNTGFDGLILIEPDVYEDNRGHFYEFYNKKVYEQAGINADFVQDNRSRSVYGVLRGLHFQRDEMAQAKLVTVLNGRVLDVAVDLRPESATFGRYYAVELSAENKRQLFIPRGFAHGFVVLSPEADFFYKCDNYYAPTHDCGIIYNDKTLAIDWKIDEKDIILSAKDSQLPTFEEVIHFINHGG